MGRWEPRARSGKQRRQLETGANSGWKLHSRSPALSGSGYVMGRTVLATQLCLSSKPCLVHLQLSYIVTDWMGEDWGWDQE